MASYLSTDSLIESIKRRANIPTSQVTFQDDDFLAFANEEIAIGLLPAIMQFHEEYLVYSEDIPLVANKSAYVIPNRAVGAKIRNIFYKDTQGNLMEMVRISPDDLAHYENSFNSNTYHKYYLKNNTIVLVPSVSANASGSLRVDYYLRPNQLVSEDRVGVITDIDTTTGVVTVSDLPSVFSLSSTYDLIEARGGHRTLALDLTPTALSTSADSITFTTSDLPSDLQIGDHVALSGECKVPQIPDDLHVILAQRVAARCLESLGDQAGLQAANLKLAEMELKMGTLIDNRTESDPIKATNFNSPLRMTRNRYRRTL